MRRMGGQEDVTDKASFIQRPVGMEAVAMEKKDLRRGRPAEWKVLAVC